MTAPPVQTKPADIKIPLEVMRTGHIAVRAYINGKGPFRLGLDTGSPVTFVTNVCAVKAGLMNAAEAKQEVMIRLPRRASEVRIGDASVKNLEVMIIDHPTVQLIGQLDGGLDGLVGFTFFSRFKMLLDYPIKRATLTPNSYQPTDLIQSLYQRVMGATSAAKVIAPAGLWGLAVAKTDSSPGVTIQKVYPGTPAESAGLRPGDRLLEIEGRWTEAPLDVAEAARWIKPGQTAAVKLLRDGVEVVVRVRVAVGV